MLYSYTHFKDQEMIDHFSRTFQLYRLCEFYSRTLGTFSMASRRPINVRRTPSPPPPSLWDTKGLSLNQKPSVGDLFRGNLRRRPVVTRGGR
jgi:hypothetical protein